MVMECSTRTKSTPLFEIDFEVEKVPKRSAVKNSLRQRSTLSSSHTRFSMRDSLPRHLTKPTPSRQRVSVSCPTVRGFASHGFRNCRSLCCLSPDSFDSMRQMSQFKSTWMTLEYQSLVTLRSSAGESSSNAIAVLSQLEYMGSRCLLRLSEETDGWLGKILIGSNFAAAHYFTS